MNHARAFAVFAVFCFVAAACADSASSAPATAPTTYAAVTTVNFDKDEVGKPPAGWTATQTGEGKAVWAVVKDDSAPSKPNVLKQSGTADYPVCFKNDTSLKDGFVEVKFKPVEGKDDQAGGVVWRVKDADNYYIARVNALEDNVIIFRTVEGMRMSLEGEKVKVRTREWCTLRVEFKGRKFVAYLNGKNVLEVKDETLKEAGKVGVWTKADSVSLFDDFKYGS